MMSPTIRRRLYTVVALVVATPLAWWAGRTLEQRSAQQADEQEAKERVFACQSQVVGLQLGSPQAPEHSIVVSRRVSASYPYDPQAAWRLEAPLAAAADETTTMAIVEAACALKRLTRIEAKAGEPPLSVSAFGLEPPKKFLRLVFLDGSEQRVDVGDASAFNQSMYVRRQLAPGEPADSIDVVDQGFSFQVERDALSLRDKRLVHVHNADVKRIEVKARGKPSFFVEPSGQGEYSIVQQGDGHDPFPGDAQAVGGLLDGLVNLRAKQFLDEAPTAARLPHFSLAPPSFEVVLGLTDANERIVLRLGALAVHNERHVFAQAASSTTPVVEVENASIVDKLSDGGLSLRDMRMLHCHPADVARIEVQQQGATLTLVRQSEPTAGAWALEGQDTRPLDSSRISQLLYRLTHLRADTLALEAAKSEELQAASLDSPDLSIRLTDHKGDQLGHLRVGVASAERRAAIGDGERIGQIFASALEGVSTQADDYLSTP